MNKKLECNDNIEIDVQGKPEQNDTNIFRRELLEWYDAHRRVLPWRALLNQTADPCHVWLSEIMLQQTVVAAVIPYFLKFTERWPRVQDLAQADNDEVMSAWAGLGYYARARNLHKCAKIVSEELDGVFPRDQKALKQLPGIGDYTSAAIRAIAFGLPAVVVDGNVERVMARFHAVTEPLPASKGHLKQLTADVAEGQTERPSDFAQAMMDLGATICTPKSPKCALCPLSYGCQAYAQNIAADLPRKLPKKKKPEKFGYIYWVESTCGEILLEKRPDTGLLGGMNGFPTSAWLENSASKAHITILDGVSFAPENINAVVYHSFTHFNLTLEGIKTVVSKSSFCTPDGFYWHKRDDVMNLAFPTLFAKYLRLMK